MTVYGLDDRGSISGWGRDFSSPPRPDLLWAHLILGVISRGLAVWIIKLAARLRLLPTLRMRGAIYPRLLTYSYRGA
jgi:hypothetical protein